MKTKKIMKLFTCVSILTLIFSPVIAHSGLFDDIGKIFKSAPKPQPPPPPTQKPPEDHTKAPTRKNPPQLPTCKEDEVIKNGECVKKK